MAPSEANKEAGTSASYVLFDKDGSTLRRFELCEQGWDQE